MGIRADHLLNCVIAPTLKRMDAYSDEAAMLLLGTAAQESHCGEYLRQHPRGPALGIYQMEGWVHEDAWRNYLRYREQWNRVARQIAGVPDPEPKLMVANLAYATCMARIQYLRDPHPIPDTIEGQAKTWKRFWNTEKGAGTVEQYIKNWERLVAPCLESTEGDIFIDHASDPRA